MMRSQPEVAAGRVPYAVAYERCGGDKDIGSHEGTRIQVAMYPAAFGIFSIQAAK